MEVTATVERRLLAPARLLVVLAAGALVASGCGGNDSPVVRPPEGSATATTSATTSPATSPSEAPSTGGSATPARHPRTTVRPATGLRDGQTVTVTASGFSPGLSLIVVQCADKGQETGPGDCNLTVSTSVRTDADGRATTQLQVARGPFGTNNDVCSATQPCLVSVTEASFDPTEEADATISFD